MLPELRHATTAEADLRAMGAALLAAVTRQTGKHMFDGQPHAKAEFLAAMDEPLFDALGHHGILEASGAQWRARFAVRAVDELVIVTDLPAPHRHAPAGYVDPLWVGAGLARLLAFPEGGLCLDMGTGCGIFAIAMAKRSSKAIGVDINPRALRVAAFNAALNGVTNVEFRASDLFSAVAGTRFDYIAFNSPTGEDFSPQNRQHAGEAILQAFFTALPDHLAPGGLTQISMCGKDWVDATFLDHVDDWLGEDAGRFQFVSLEHWRTTRGRLFFLRRLSASLRLRMNAFRCKVFMKGVLSLREGDLAASVVVETRYHDWLFVEPAGSGTALIERLFGRSDSAARLSPRLAQLAEAARPLARQPEKR